MSNGGSISCSEEFNDNTSLLNEAFELVEQKASQEQQLLDQQRCSLPMHHHVYKQDPPDGLLPHRPSLIQHQQLQHQAYQLPEQPPSQPQSVYQMPSNEYCPEPQAQYDINSQLRQPHHPRLQSNSSDDRHISNVSFRTASCNGNSDNDDDLAG